MTITMSNEMAVTLKELRSKRGSSLQCVSDAVNISKTLLFDLENGSATNPCIDTITKLAYFYNVRITDIIGGYIDSKNIDSSAIAIYRALYTFPEIDKETIRILIKRLKEIKDKDNVQNIHN